MSSKQKTVYSGIGGQAVLEGIMMRNNDRYSIAVRKSDGSIATTKEETASFSSKHKWARVPFVRGAVSFVDSMVLGLKTLTWSSNMALDEGEEGKQEKLSGGAMALTLVISLALAIGLFIVVPTLITNFLKQWIASYALLAVIEGVIRIAIFVAYILAVSLMKDIRRTFMYHGSEHKCINCLEHGLPLTVENVMKSSKEHRRCGTSFLLFVMLVSIVLFMFIRVDNVFLKVALRIALLPVVAGISYELIRLNGRFDNWFTYILSRPGMWLQALTTREPTEDMAEVAIRAVEEVFDWKAFLKEHFAYDDDPGMAENK